MNKFKLWIKANWLAEDTNIFKNYRDALGGLVVLILIPLLSIWLVISINEYTFWSYTFPFLSISLAGAYDTYGRYEGVSPKNFKLVIRVILDFTALFFAVFSIGTDSLVLPYIAPALLVICGLFLTFEIYNRVKRAILISPWIAY